MDAAAMDRVTSALYAINENLTSINYKLEEILEAVIGLVQAQQ